jgi:hypothetical protein
MTSRHGEGPWNGWRFYMDYKGGGSYAPSIDGAATHTFFVARASTLTMFVFTP